MHTPSQPVRLRPALLGWAVVLGAAGVVLCFVPLFNLLGYESSLALAFLASVAGAHLGMTAVSCARCQQSPADAERADAHPGRAVLSCFGRGALAALAVLVAPLGLLLGNGLRVRNCDYLGGLSFFGLMPVCSALCAAALGTICGLIARRRRAAALLAFSGLLGSLLWAGQRFLASPAIYAYDPFFGYFPGALYDEEVTIHGAFLAARLYHAIGAAAALCAAAALLDGHGLRLRRLPRGRAALAGAVLVLSSIFLVLHARQADLGLYHDPAAVDRQLSAERRTEHFVLRYTPGGAVSREIDLIAREHEFRYQQLRDTLGVEPDWAPSRLSRLLGMENRHGQPGHPVVVSYLFENAAQKRALMGAAGTYIAKPWRREIYLQHDAWPHPVLKHELAHVFWGAAGDGLLRLSMRGALPSQGMIEGAAVAADWRGGKLTGHQAVRAMREARLEPPLGAVFGLSFWALPSGRAYTVAGSFCRWLLDRYGPAPLRAAYRDGGSPAAVSHAYGVPFGKLAAEWRAFIDGQRVAPQEREVERERVRRPAVFYKICAHELALRRQAAQQAQARGDLAEAVRLMQWVCRDDRGEPRHQTDLMGLLWSAGRYAEATAVGQAMLEHPAMTPVLEANVRALLGDIQWIQDHPDQADAEYARAQALPSDESLGRLLWAKRWALAHAAGASTAGRLVMQVLVGEPGAARPEHDASLDALRLRQAAEALPAEGLPHYLLGRQLYNHGAYREAAAEMAEALRLGLIDRRFNVQAGRLRGEALLRAGEARQALPVFEWVRDTLLSPSPQNEGQRLDLSDWMERARAWQDGSG